MGVLLDRFLRARHPVAASLVVTLAGMSLVLAVALLPVAAREALTFTPGAFVVLHSLSVAFVVTIAFSIFGVGWYTHDLARDRHLLFLGCAFLSIGLMDAMHGLSYPGMPDFLTPNTLDRSGQLWLFSRLFAASAFLGSAFIAPDRAERWLNRAVLGSASVLIAAAVFVAVIFFPEDLPAVIGPGGGTAFRWIAEAVIVLLLVVAIAAHWKRYTRYRALTAIVYVPALSLFTMSELCTLGFQGAQGPWIVLGHLFNVAGSFLVYRGVFIAAVRRPHARLLEASRALETEMVRRGEAQAALARSASELVQERDRISAVMEAVPVAVLWADKLSRVVFANGTVERILGVPRAEIRTWLAGDRGWEITDPSGKPIEPEDTPLAVVARTRAPLRMRLFLRRRTGPRQLLDVFGAPFFDAAGAFDGAVLAFEDVTERNQLDEQLRQAQKMEAVGRLAGGVAHDFNNLLTAILGASEQLLEQLPPGTPAHEDAGEIRLAGERAAVLTRQLLTFSRKQVVHPRVLALDELVAGLLPILRRLMGEDVELVSRNSAMGLVRADPGQLEQVIMNLVMNARDAMPAGGRIRLETYDADVGPEEAREQVGVQPGPYVVLTTRDTGTGMDPEVLSHLFEPFFTTKEPGRGTGLGLSTIYGIVRQAGGHVRVDSAKGVGTVFRVYLPRVEGGLDEAEHAEHGAVRSLSPVHVLLVEDELQVRTAMTRTLRRAGHQVVEAQDAEDALRLAADPARHVDLLVTDVVMPRVGGRELAARIRGMRPGLKVLFVSGYVGPGFPLDKLGDDSAFLQKPFTPAVLVEALSALLVPAERLAAQGS